MPALKLFISHSSRLDDMPDPAHRYTSKDANWCLLDETCRALKDRYKDAIHILVDGCAENRQDWAGLLPGDDWNKKLNLWLAECHAAVFLISERALTRSDWVAKEAAILGWRRALDPEFTLIPVTIEGESNAADLASGFFGSLDLGRLDCAHAPERPAAAIVAQIAAAPMLGDPAALAARCCDTPLDLLRRSIAHSLATHADPGVLDAAVAEQGDDEDDRPDVALPLRERSAQVLARRLLKLSLVDICSCFRIFRTVLCHADLSYDQAHGILEKVRPLWVDPGAAAFLPAALDDRRALALCSQFVTYPDDLLGTDGYTLERYLERAWPGARPRRVPITTACTAAEVQTEIRRRVLGDGLPPTVTGTQMDFQVNEEPTAIIVVLNTAGAHGAPPDPRLLLDLESLTRIYPNLVLVIATCTPAEFLPERLRVIAPALDPEDETQAMLAERAITTHLNDRYKRPQ
ncbi:MAG TPA: hypothetical protein VES73_13200 [Lamprocystis sp. (in: g-proteobacteria)]|nr:hypothetical protein [Lamprocystis sp. (in: g-proteobacteria)]